MIAYRLSYNGLNAYFPSIHEANAAVTRLLTSEPYDRVVVYHVTMLEIPMPENERALIGILNGRDHIEMQYMNRTLIPFVGNPANLVIGDHAFLRYDSPEHPKQYVQIMGFNPTFAKPFRVNLLFPDSPHEPFSVAAAHLELATPCAIRDNVLLLRGINVFKKAAWRLTKLLQKQFTNQTTATDILEVLTPALTSDHDRAVLPFLYLFKDSDYIRGFLQTARSDILGADTPAKYDQVIVHLLNTISDYVEREEL